MAADKAGSVRRRRMSLTDKKILKELLERDGTLGTNTLARRLGIPRSTVLRRRRFLEQYVIASSYTIDLSKYGFRRIDFLVETMHGMTSKLAKQFLQFPEVVSVAKTIGEHVIDLKVELIIRTNGQILNLLEKVKAMAGVKDVIWTEVIEEERKKRVVPDYVIDSL
jgi:DNA-binding Lrp family transcriptional regulator